MNLSRRVARLMGLAPFSQLAGLARGTPERSAGRLVSATAVLVVSFLLATGAACLADDASANSSTNSASGNPVGDYFKNWFVRASEIQAAQPHWVTPLVTVTPRLEQELRYDQMWESLAGGHTLTIYGGGGGKGLELIPFNPVEVIIGIPSWQTENTTPSKNGWSDQSFLVKYRLFSGNEENGNYIVTAFMGLTVPNGSHEFTSHHFSYSPTIAAGKGWGDFAVQSTLGVSVPDGSGADTIGTPLLSNTALQYRVFKYFWPEVEANYTYWPNGKHEHLSQLFITPGLIIGRIPISGRLGLTFGAGCQVAVTDNPLYHRNIILTGRLPF